MVAEQTWSLGALLDWTAKHLAQKGMEFPRLDAEVLLAHAAGCKRIDLYGIRHAEVASPQTRQKYRDLIRRRMEGCPVAYLVGRKEFFGLEFEVTPAVLIPRPDSEHVVMECLGLAKAVELVHIADIGAGSGNLAVALAKQLPKAQVTAIDASPDALAVARKNADKHGVAERIRFVQSDLFAALENEQFDFIVSNPPYVASEEMSKLPPGVRDYEPKSALDGGPGGFAVFDRLIDAARQHLSSGAYLLVEIGAPQEEQARARISGFAEYELAPTIHDYSGHPRVLKARKK
ncbi:MAG: peptide chain release factor N(5)-glutamine methyltransferase [Gemmataceae bacterium]|nr:peptide chain release factor N(5)-glutamine methyltransferase [Gemmataceae bacterium]MCI0737949.1 peptide chain release factor N(5)-glutamine methyltransferase [Gemmataceae bacterium]